MCEINGIRDGYYMCAIYIAVLWSMPITMRSFASKT
jgi:hypothetical protein